MNTYNSLEEKINKANQNVLNQGKSRDSQQQILQDARIEMGYKDPEILPVVFTETLEGETPLGGEMRLHLPTTDE